MTLIDRKPIFYSLLTGILMTCIMSCSDKTVVQNHEQVSFIIGESLIKEISAGELSQHIQVHNVELYDVEYKKDKKYPS